MSKEQACQVMELQSYVTRLRAMRRAGCGGNILRDPSSSLFMTKFRTRLETADRAAQMVRSETRAGRDIC